VIVADSESAFASRPVWEPENDEQMVDNDWLAIIANIKSATQLCIDRVSSHRACRLDCSRGWSYAGAPRIS